MARKPDIPSEFAHFLRDIGIRAFDHVASRLEQEIRPEEGMVRKLARQWNTLPPAEKERFFGYVVTAAELAVAAAPVLSVGLATAAKVRRATRPKKAAAAPVEEGAPRRYYDPADAEATLPGKIKKRNKKEMIIDIETVSKSSDQFDAKKKNGKT
jgi:hypothetical protein